MSISVFSRQSIFSCSSVFVVSLLLGTFLSMPVMATDYVVSGGGSPPLIIDGDDTVTVTSTGHIYNSGSDIPLSVSGMNNVISNDNQIASDTEAIVLNADDNTNIMNGTYGYIFGGTKGIVVNNSNNTVISNASSSGTIFGDQAAIEINNSDNTTINNTDGSYISGNVSAVVINGSSNTEFVNDGYVDGASASVKISDSTDVTLTNNFIMSGYDKSIVIDNSQDVTITNNYNITADNNAISIENGSNDITIVNNGNITDNAGTQAINITNSNDNTIINNGEISGLTIGGMNNKLILGAGSITNNINLTNATDAVIEYTTGISFPTEGGGYGTGSNNAVPVYNISGGALGSNYTINDLAGYTPPSAVLVSSNGQTLAVTPDEFMGAESTIVNNASTQTGNLIIQRQQNMVVDRAMPDKTASADKLNAVPTAAGGGKPDKLFWAEGFGSYRERPQNGDSAYSKANAGGVMLGVDHAENMDGYRSGLYVGGFSGSNDLGKTSFRMIDSQGGLAGAYIGKTLDNDIYISGQLAGGIAMNDSDRRVGSDTAHANYNSYFVTPSVTAMRPVPAALGVTLVPSATLRYVAQYAESYTETGSTANQRVDSRTGQTVGGRVQVTAHLPQPQVGAGTLKTAIRVGVDGETAVGSQQVDLNVLGTNVSFDPTTGSTVDGIIGLDLSYQMDTGPEVYFNGETQLGLNQGGPSDNIGTTGRIGVRWTF